MEAFLYARVSSQEQAKGWSPKTQLDACREYAAQQGLGIAGEYSDTETGATTERDGFQNMMQAVRAGRASVVIIYQTDRLHRDLAHAMLTRRELQRLGVELHTVKRGKSGTTPEDQFADNIDDLLAELERARIIERTNRGKIAKMQSGQVLGAGPAPYGYVYEGRNRERKLVVDEESARIVRLIFQWYVTGDEHGSGPLNVHLIAERLTAMQVPSPADRAGREKWHKERPMGAWSRNHVYPILNQTAYSGTYVINRRKRLDKTHFAKRKESEHFRIQVPALIDPELWEAAQRRLEQGRAMSKGHRTHDYLLGRRIRCACGYGVHGRATSKSGRHHCKRLWYICNARIRRLTAHPCSIPLPWFRAETVDQIVWDYIAWLMGDPDLLEDRIAIRQRRIQRDHVTLEPTRDDLLARKGKLERANQRILDLYEAEEIDRQEWRRRKAANDELISDLDKQLAKLDTPIDEAPPLTNRMADAVRKLAVDMRPRLATLSFDARRQVIDSLNVQVTLSAPEGEKRIHVESILGVDDLEMP